MTGKTYYNIVNACIQTFNTNHFISDFRIRTRICLFTDRWTMSIVLISSKGRVRMSLIVTNTLKPPYK